MPDRTLLVIFHSGGEFVWDNGSPIYIGGCPKMAFMKRSITYSQLVQKTYDLSNWSTNGHCPIIQYLHQNGKVSTLVHITNDEDVENMFRASAWDASALYLHIQTGAVNEIKHQGKAQRVGSSKSVQPSNPPSILGKRDAAGHILHHRQELNTNSRINEDAIATDTLPSPKVNPTMKVYDLAPKATSVVKESCFQQSYPSVDLGADSDLLFTQGGYACIEENPFAENDVGLGTDNDNLNWLHVAAEICKEGGYTSRREELPFPENDAGLGTDTDNLVSLHVDIERCKRGVTCGGEELPFAEKEVGLGTDNDNLDSLHVDTDSCKEVPACYGLGSSRHTECYLEKHQTRSVAGPFHNIPSNDSRGWDLFTDAAEGVPNQAATNVRMKQKRLTTRKQRMIFFPCHPGKKRRMRCGRAGCLVVVTHSKAHWPNLHSIRTNRFAATARCNISTCPWRIHASIVEAGPQFEVRTYNPEHNCTGPLNGTKFTQATSGLIAEFIRERLRVHQDYRPKEIVSDFQREFGVQISYRKAHLVKEIAMKQIRGSFEDSYRILCNYRLEPKCINPGTVDNLWIEDDHSFQRYYVCFGGCARSFKTSIMPLIALDGTHLRGKYPGALLITVCQDGDHGLFPLAVALAEFECYATWSWFLANLDETLDHVRNLTIVSDRMKGLTNAMRDVLPTAKHCYCCRHISQNIQANFKNDGIVMKFWCTARSTRVCDYENYMAEIRSIDVEAVVTFHKISKKNLKMMKSS